MGFHLPEYRQTSDELEETKPRLTRIDRIAIGFAFLLLFALLLPAYFALREQRYFQQCQSNMKNIGDALNQYMLDNGNGLPSAYPLMFSSHGGSAPPGWIVGIHNRIKKRTDGGSSLICIKSQKEENAKLPSADGSSIMTSYGFYVGVSGAQDFEIPEPNGTIVVAETITGTAFDTLNPLSLDDNDGYLVGYDDSNQMPTKSSKYLTRLAVKRLKPTASWDDADLLMPRHGKNGFSVLYADGHVGSLSPYEIRLPRDVFGSIIRPWRPLQKKKSNQ